MPPSMQPIGGPWSTAWWYAGLAIAWFGYGGCKDLLRWLIDALRQPTLTARLPNKQFTEASTAECPHVRFFHLLIHNGGSRTARNCQVRLMSVGVGDKAIPGSGPTPLHWAHAQLSCDRRDIMSDEDAELDLFTQMPNQCELIHPFRVSSIPDGIVSSYPCGVYTWHLRLTSDNGKRRDFYLSVKHMDLSPSIPPVVTLLPSGEVPSPAETA